MAILESTRQRSDPSHHRNEAHMRTMVRSQAHAFLAGSALLKAATDEAATEEELGGADMHARISGLADYVVDNDRGGIAKIREVMRTIGWADKPNEARWKPPRYDAEDLLGLMPSDPRDTRDVLGIALAIAVEAARRPVSPIQFGVARF